MTPIRLAGSRTVPLTFVLLITGSCAMALPAALAPDPNPPPGFQWLACAGGRPTDTVRGVIGSGGGDLTHPSGHVLSVSPGAVPDNRTFTLHEPASTHVQVIATVSGNVSFAAPVTLTMSFERCPATVDPDTLRIFRVNPGGRHENFGGQREGRTVRSDPLDRLSLYAIGMN
jgi:hypothetical protein